MRTTQTLGCSRRTAIAAALGGAALLGVGPAPVPGAAAQRSSIGGGVAGGGLARAIEGDGEAQFALFASRLTLPGDDAPTFFGQLHWQDADGTVLRSTAITTYGPIPGGEENARELVGLVTIGDDEAEQPFVLRVLVDDGPPGSGGDEIDLRVGPGAATPGAAAAALVYEATMTVVTGDLQLLTFDA